MFKNVSTILFDLGGVILNLDYKRTIEAFKKIGKENFETLYTQAQQNPIFDQFETGEISEEEFRDYIRSIIGEHISDQEIDEAWNAMLLDLPLERIDLLFALKDKYRIYLFSNTNAIHLRKFQEIIEKEHGNKELLETVFHKTYYSHLIGQRKPNAAAFEFILEEQGLNPEEVVFIDDSLQHIEGASSIGITALHLIDTDIITLCKPFV